MTGGEPTTSSPPQRVLIVANQTIAGAQLGDALGAILAAAPSCSFHLLVPVTAAASSIAVGLAAVESAATALIELPDPRLVAEERLAAGLAWLESIGAASSGELCTGDVVDAVAACVQRQSADAVIVSTLPSRISKWLKQDLPCRIERRVSVPVTVVTARA